MPMIAITDGKPATVARAGQANRNEVTTEKVSFRSEVLAE
jgi:hypothetical protein